MSKFGATRPGATIIGAKKVATKTYTISLKGIPVVTAERKKKMQAAARKPNGKRSYPKLIEA